jgi:hypothetical protein
MYCTVLYSTGLGCTKSTVSKVFCLSTTEEIQEMKKIWEQKNDSPLADRLRSELSGQHENLMIYLLLNGRSSAARDESFSSHKAEDIYRAVKNGKTMMGGLSSKAEIQVAELIAQTGPEQLADLHSAWEQKYSSKEGSLRNMLIKRLSGGELFSTFLQCPRM